jgi:hypothetical protein
MSGCFTRLAPAVAIAVACATTLAARQSPVATPNATPRARLGPDAIAGRWTFDDKDSREDQKNWRRPVADDTQTLTGPRSTPPAVGLWTPGPGVPMNGVGPRSSAGLFDNDVRRAMRDLLELAPMYDVSIGDGTVTITDDLEHKTTFATDGRKEKHMQGATEYESHTTWNADGQLVQDVSWTKELRISEIWFPGDDGASLFVWMKVLKPTFTPPVKDIRRTYTKASR